MPNDDLPDWLMQHRWMVGANLRDARRSRSLTQEQLAELAAVDGKTISRAENGVYAITVDFVAKLARALDVPSWQLFLDKNATVTPADRSGDSSTQETPPAVAPDSPGGR